VTLAPRNATEDAILEAARELLSEGAHEQVTIDTIARRAFVSRTTVYFYFENKRAVMDRLIQQAFADMDDAASPYFEGAGDPRMELALGLARFVAVVNRNGSILMLAAHLYGEDEHMPSQWEPYVNRFIAGAEARIARDQLRGLAPDDIPARVAAQALCAMVERHLTIEVIRNGRDMREAVRQLTEPDSRNRQASATGPASLVSHGSGAWPCHASASSSKPGIEPAATDLMGPAETRFERTPRAPRSRAR
jgi:AcrR family transcriptional regulator